MKKYFYFLIILLAIVALVATGCAPAAEEESVTEEEPAELIKLTVALSNANIWIQPVIASAMGFDEEVGIDIELVPFRTGRMATDALIGGSTDIATTAMGPTISAAFQGQQIAILAENARFPGEKITARVDSGISSAEDLRGKTIGVTLGSDVHYFLSIYLAYYGISDDEVEIINLGPGDMVIALQGGDIDAFASWAPQPDKAKEAMGDDAIFIEQPEPGWHEGIYLIATMQNLLEEKPEAFEMFMKALIMADEYAETNPEETAQIIADQLEVDVPTAKDLMVGRTYKIQLDQGIIDGAVARAEWQIEYEMAPEGAEIPDFKSLLAVETLNAVDPTRVTLD